jgi:hypothetical protein
VPTTTAAATEASFPSFGIQTSAIGWADYIGPPWGKRKSGR